MRQGQTKPEASSKLGMGWHEWHCMDNVVEEFKVLERERNNMKEISAWLVADRVPWL